MTWGAAWYVAGGVFVSLVNTGQITGSLFMAGGLSWGLTGAVAGLGYCAALALGERGRSFRELGYGRMGVWGGLGAIVAAIPVMLGVTGSWGGLLQVMASPFPVVVGVLGSVSAISSLAVARQADGGLPGPSELQQLEGQIDGDALARSRGV